MLKIKRFFYFPALLLFLCSNAVYASGWTEVRTLEGRITTLSQHFEKDKWTLVMLWAADCSVCAQEYPAISDFHTRHRDADAKVIGVSLDGYSQLEKITRHIDEMPMSFDNLIGDLTVIAFHYRTATTKPFQGTPTYLMYNPPGAVCRLSRRTGKPRGPGKIHSAPSIVRLSVYTHTWYPGSTVVIQFLSSAYLASTSSSRISSTE